MELVSGLVENARQNGHPIDVDLTSQWHMQPLVVIVESFLRLASPSYQRRSLYRAQHFRAMPTIVDSGF